MGEKPGERTANENGWSTALLAALLLLCAWAVVVARLHDPTRFWNFGYIHGGSLCFVDRCDPFDTHNLDLVGQQHGEPARPVLNPEYPVYPPSTLLLALPLNPFGWPGSGLIFFGISLIAYGLAMTVMVRSVHKGPWVAGSIVLLTLLSSRSPWLGLYYGNPVILCAGIMTLACVLLLAPARRHNIAAIVLLAFALCIKPQLAIGAVLFFLWRRDTRKSAWTACLLFLAFAVLATLLYAARLHGFAYLSTESRILKLGFLPGHSSDGSLLNPNAFRFINLEPLMSGLSLGSNAAKLASLAVTAVCAVLLFRTVNGTAALRQRPWTCLSLLLLLSCMPLYHREYDRCLLLALAPAAMEAEDHPVLRWLTPGAALLWFWSEPLIPMVLPMTQGLPLNAPLTLVLFGLLLWSLHHGNRPRIASLASESLTTPVSA